MQNMSRQYKRAESLIRTILFYDWDPIGVSEEDVDVIAFAKLQHEYDRYIPSIYTLIIRNDRAALLNLLSTIVTEEMGMERSNPRADDKVVDLLLRLDITSSS